MLYNYNKPSQHDMCMWELSMCVIELTRCLPCLNLKPVTGENKFAKYQLSYWC